MSQLLWVAICWAARVRFLISGDYRLISIKCEINKHTQSARDCIIFCKKKKTNRSRMRALRMKEDGKREFAKQKSKHFVSFLFFVFFF